MSTELTVIESQKPLLDMSYRDKLTAASDIAKLLSDVIDKQKFYQVIQGKKFVRVEGWITLGSLLGVIPRERSVVETPDGSFVAEIDLVRADTGKVIGGASSLCSIEEKRWGGADKFARRSMAITRATGKSYRIAFGWIVGLAGYETCNAEEMPETSSEENPVFQGTIEQTEKLTEHLKKINVPEEKIATILASMKGKTKSALEGVLKNALQQ